MDKELLIFLLAFTFFIVFWSIKYQASYFKAHHFFFLIGFVFYMLLYPLLYIFELTKDSHSDEIVLRGLFVSFIGLISYLFSRWLFSQLISRNNVNGDVFYNGVMRNVKNNGTVFIKNRYFFILVLLTAFLLIDIVLSGSRYGYGGYVNKSLIFLIAVSLSVLMHRNNKIKVKLIFVAIGISFLFVVNNSSSRTDVVKVIICAFVIVQYIGLKGLFKNIVLLLSSFAAILVGVLVVTMTRSYDMSKSTGYYLNRMYDHHDGISGLFLVLADFGIAHDNYLYIVENIEEIGYLWGVSFVRIFTAFIPRAIWFDKPFDVQTLIVSQGIATNTYASGSSQSMTFIGEMYWNMGVIAVIVGMMGIGILLSLLDKKLLSRQPVWVMISLAMVPFSFLLWRGAFNTVLIYICISAIFLVVIYKLTTVLNLILRKSVIKKI